MPDYLVILSVLEGRKFPKRNGVKVVVEARFNDELMSTDPVDHHFNPDFNTELAWTISKKGLHLHRLQRTPIKVHCYAKRQNSNVELLGYLVFDIRLAVQNSQPPRWYPLLGPKYRDPKPELLIGLSLEPDKQLPDAADSVISDKSIVSNEEFNSDKYLQPVTTSASPLQLNLNAEDGIYEIGKQLDSAVFSLSVTIAYTKNIDALIPRTSGIKIKSGLFFYYSLLGNDVTTDPFHSYVNPEFPAERASVKIKCNSTNLKKFIGELPNLQMYLCCGDVTFGRAEIPLCNLISGHVNVDMQPATIEGVYELKHLGNNEYVDDNVKSVVGVSVCLRKENMRSAKGFPSRQESRIQDLSEKNPKEPNPERMSRKKLDFESPLGSREVSERKNSPPADIPQTFEDGPSSKVQSDKLPEDIESGGDEGGDSNEIRWFRFTIDLRKFTSLTKDSFRCSLRYFYPFFGSSVPISSHPIFDANYKQPVTVPHGYCMFNFATTQTSLEETFRTSPLVVEIQSHTDSNAEIIGVSSISLHLILDANNSSITNDSGTKGSRKLCTSSYHVESIKYRHDMGELFVVMALDDFGPVKLPSDEKFAAASEIKDSERRSTVKDTDKSADVPSNLPKPTGRSRYDDESSALRIAMELETWKEQQEILFRKQLKDRERKHMMALSSEWKKRDMEREKILQKKLKEHEEVEKRMKESLAEIEQQRRRLTDGERRVIELKSDLEKQRERLSQSTKEMVQTIKDECERNVEEERKKNFDLSEYHRRLVEEVKELKMKSKKSEQDFESYKKDLKFQPEVRLQSRVDILNLEKVELERKLESATTSKIHYKQQWGRALKELSRIKHVQQEQAKMQLQRQQQELETLRLQYLLNDKRSGGPSEERKLLHQIQTELTKLNDNGRMDSDDQDQIVSKDTDPENSNDLVQRLIDERDTLLQTGVYTTDDKVIDEINKSIRCTIDRTT